MPINRRKFIVGTGTFVIAPKAWSQSQVRVVPGAQTVPQVRIGIILVGLSWCPYCKNAAALLYHAMPPLSIPVLIASKDNRAIEPYTEFMSASEHPIANQITRVPTTLFYQPNEDRLVDMIEGFRNPRSYLAKLKSVVGAAVEAGYVS
ncbi:hypothetical protein A9Q96_10025 [Rhodobacterales bacterium 52_120_T64]|nr:hypothetical protein A9Q96_10025 [Rhodobacterales bacterium 52_120_T64]